MNRLIFVRRAILVLAAAALSACSIVLGSSEPAGTVSFVTPPDGSSVQSPFRVAMSAEGVAVEPAGQVRDGYGHHHIVIDRELPPFDKVVPSDEHHRHFGKAQTEAVLDLPPGEHTLRLLFANGDHIPYGPVITDTVTITVTDRRGVSFVEPKDSANIISPFTVRMMSDGLAVEPAGTVRDGAGHHHIVIDRELPPAGQPVPSDEHHRHFGKGQTETVLDLPPGEQQPERVFATGDHVPYEPAITDTIEVTVTERRGVSFAEPEDGAKVTSPFNVRMMAEGLALEAAGQVRDRYGHHHIVIDRALPPPGQPVPSDEHHRHFGKGQTETVLDLPPGEHTLRLLFATGDHIPYDPAITYVVKITVVE